MQTKFIYFTDLHLQVKAPSSRTDDYLASLLLKVDEIISLYKEHNAVGILCGGDLFNTQQPGLRAFAELLFRFRKVPVYGVLGSHDYYGYQVLSIPETAPGYLMLLEGFTLLDERGTCFPDNIRVVGMCHEADQSIETLRVTKLNSDETLIQIVHGDLFVEKVPWPHILVSEIQTDADLVLAGHYHAGWGPVTYNSTTFVHPGSVARTDQSERDITPCVLLITVENTKISLERIPLASARSASEVFRSVSDATSNKVLLGEFVESVRGLNTQSMGSLRDAIVKVGEAQGNAQVVPFLLGELTKVEASRV